MKISQQSILKSFLNGFSKSNMRHISICTSTDANMMVRCETMTLWSFHIRPPTFCEMLWEKYNWCMFVSVPVRIIIIGVELARNLLTFYEIPRTISAQQLSDVCLYPAVVFLRVKYIFLSALPHAFLYSFLFAYISSGQNSFLYHREWSLVTTPNWILKHENVDPTFQV